MDALTRRAPAGMKHRIAAELRPQRLSANQTLALAGDPNPPLWALLEGWVSLSSGAGAEDAGPVDLISGAAWLQAIDCNGRSAATICVRESATVAAIPASRLDRIRAEDPLLFGWLMEATTAMLPRLMLALSDNLLPTGERRCAAALLRLIPAAGFEVPVSQSELAELAGMSRHTAGRVLRDFERAGMITIGYRHILVHDQDRVRAVREGIRQARAA